MFSQHATGLRAVLLYRRALCCVILCCFFCVLTAELRVPYHLAGGGGVGLVLVSRIVRECLCVCVCVLLGQQVVA